MKNGGTEAQSKASVGPKGIQLTQNPSVGSFPVNAGIISGFQLLRSGRKGNGTMGLEQPDPRDLRVSEEAEKAVRRAYRGGELSSQGSGEAGLSRLLPS